MIYRSFLFIFIFFHINKIQAQNIHLEKDSIKEFTALRITNPHEINDFLNYIDYNKAKNIFKSLGVGFKKNISNFAFKANR